MDTVQLIATQFCNITLECKTRLYVPYSYFNEVALLGGGGEIRCLENAVKKHAYHNLMLSKKGKVK